MSKTIECCNCAILFCLPDGYERQRRRDHKDFSCPNGHEQHFTGKSDLEELRAEIAGLKRNLSYARGARDELRVQLEHWQAVAYGYKGAMRRYQREIKLVS